MIRSEGSTISTTLTSLERNSWFRPKYFLFAIIGLMLAYVIAHDESFLVHSKDPVWQHVGSSRVDLQACKLEYSIVSPK